MEMARSLHLVGLAENLPDGDVRVIVEGPRPDCRRLIEWLFGAGSQTIHRPGRVDSVDVTWGEAQGPFTSFVCR
jgi:acylphosphatase